ncbi:hypothetical protein MKW92_013445 [Papaver armeniacum]|nr:hypothetical protein MKW92_013445 [Papaver armeniacum]
MKIEIEKINDPTKRMITFTKRRGGIKSKAAELCKLFPDINVCIIVFSPGGRAFTFTNSPLGMCNMVEQFLKEQTKDTKIENRNAHEAKNSAYWEDSYWWDNMDMKELDSVEKLKSVRESLANLKQNLSARKQKLTAVASSPLSSPSSTIEETIIEDRIVEDAATSITDDKHEAWNDHPKLDLSLNLGW